MTKISCTKDGHVLLNDGQWVSLAAIQAAVQAAQNPELYNQAPEGGRLPTVTRATPNQKLSIVNNANRISGRKTPVAANCDCSQEALELPTMLQQAEEPAANTFADDSEHLPLPTMQFPKVEHRQKVKQTINTDDAYAEGHLPLPSTSRS